VSYTIFSEETPVRSGLWNSSGESISISVNGHLYGNYNYTIRIVDVGGNIDTDTVYVYVTDGTPPTVDTPSDINYNEEEAGGSITWDPADSYPASYEIFRNRVLVKSGLWNLTSETISISVTGLSVGSYNFTIIVYDVGLNYEADIVWVTVSDATLPMIDTPIDRQIDEGQNGEVIIWNPTDLNPISYEIYREEVLFMSGLWNSSVETISVSLDGLTLGLYNFTLIVFDIGSNSANDTVWITVVDATPPSVDSPSDVYYSEGASGYNITWNPSDLHPVSYEILREGAQIKTGAWNSSFETITINVEGLTLGGYNYTIYVFDVGGNTVNDTVFVYVTDGSAPTVDSPPDVIYDEGDSGYNITWNATDAHPSSYEIYREDVLVTSGLWNSSAESISISVGGQAFGSYNYTIKVVDVGGSSARDTVFVYVQDGTGPTIDSPADVVYIEGETGHTISWSPADLHPASYQVLRESVLIESGVWNSSGEVISISVDGLSPGEYNYTISVTDLGTNSVVDQVTVTVEAAATSTTTVSSTPTTPTDSPPPPEIPVDQILIVVLTWIGTGVLLILLVEGILRRSR
jgi:hypothetical protein